MTTYLPPLTFTGDRATAARGDARRAHPARWRNRRLDGKLAALAAVESLQGCRPADLLALSATADIIDVTPGTVLAEGDDVSRFWWMPVDGWLLVSGEGKQAITVPAGWSWGSPVRRDIGGRISALRGGRVLTARLPALLAALEDHPRLADAIRATMVVPANV